MQQRHALNHALQQLQSKLLQMGEDVQEMLRIAVDVLAVRDVAKADALIQSDPDINRMEHEIEDLCIHVLVTQQPVATDLRKVVTGLRVATDLERMADLAVDVAKSAKRLQQAPPADIMADIRFIADALRNMIANALRAYVDYNPALARELATADDVVDKAYRRMVESLFTATSGQPDAMAEAITLAFVGRYLERIGDHATNIGEGVIYIATGERSDLN
ncbi:phosphate transport system regulatory protein PhoU [Alicyclobacillus contaminans]|uniref:phosphate signaling complex protein PhoU n=1 Tax=Alicyclobacillus contaminans TaxID=392016 RepID=UPI000413B968|nr:phosphate signaling complex protein PhoU [Alicyclobacillus contaminans]GMA51897.1 phosphate transport system regulatory protein PhoU [Alicyclobacillus contaminans]